jgi:hypothetical protein
MLQTSLELFDLKLIESLHKNLRQIVGTVEIVVERKKFYPTEDDPERFVEQIGIETPKVDGLKELMSFVQ